MDEHIDTLEERHPEPPDIARLHRVRRVREGGKDYYLITKLGEDRAELFRVVYPVGGWRQDWTT